MNHEKPCVLIDENPADYVFGSSTGLEFKAVNDAGDWSAYLDFNERQKFLFETDGCVLFSAQESFDAQMNHFIETGAFQQEAIEFFYAQGYMENSTLDSDKPRFHTSPRFLHVLAGTKHNGTALQQPWDILRHSGALPWADLAFDDTTTEAMYFSPIPQMLIDKAKKLLQYVSVNYQWIVKGGTGTRTLTMKNALKQAPLEIGTAVCDPWDQLHPPTCSSLSPEHSTMVYKMDTATHIEDHYIPFEKTLAPTYNIPYVFQGVISVVPQAPAPLPSVPQVSTPVTPEQRFSIVQWLGTAIQWLLNLQRSQTFGSINMSQFLKLDSADAVKGVIVAILTPIVLYIGQLLQAATTGGSLMPDWGMLIKLGISGGLGYLTKNLLTNSQGVALQGE